MFSELYQTSEKIWFLHQVKHTILCELNKRYHESFISPWWRKMFKAEFEKYIIKLANSYHPTFPKVEIAEMIRPIESLIGKTEWEVYLEHQAEKLAQHVLKAEDALEEVNVGYMLELNKTQDGFKNV